MADRYDEATRDRAIWIVRLATLGGAAGALGLTWLFSGMAEAYFSGKPPAPPAPPAVPVAAAPVQKPAPVITSVVHHPYQPGATSGTAPRPPARAPGAAPPPPPPPACHSTPSKPC